MELTTAKPVILLSFMPIAIWNGEVFAKPVPVAEITYPSPPFTDLTSSIVQSDNPLLSSSVAESSIILSEFSMSSKVFAPG